MAMMGILPLMLGVGLVGVVLIIFVIFLLLKK